MSEEEPSSGLVRYIFRRGGKDFALDFLLVIGTGFGLISGIGAAVIAVTDSSWEWALFSLVVISSVQCARARRVVHIAALQCITPILRSASDLSTMSFVLYLRSFGIDSELAATCPLVGKGNWYLPERLFGIDNTERSLSTKEQEAVRLVSRFGRTIAVGHPGESLPPLGADRLYLAKADWKSDVRDLMPRTRLVLLVAGIASDTESAAGTLWEFTEAVRVLPPSRVLLLICTGPEAYYRFRDAAATELAKRDGEHYSEVPNRVACR
jgi:hypothetical protein